MNTAPLVVDHTNIGAALRRLSLPFALQMLADQLLSLVDTIAIGAIGTVALAGATAANTVLFTAIMTISGLWNGTSIIGSQRVGASDLEGFGRTTRAGLIVPCGVGFLLAFASIFWGHDIMAAILFNGAATNDATAYLIPRCISLVPLAADAVLITALGAAGNRQLGILTLIVINAVHIPLLGILTFGFGTGHPLGVTGAGMSSLISELAGCLFAIAYVARKPAYRIFSKFQFDLKLAMRAAWLGIPETVFGFSLLAPDIAIIALLAPLGSLAIAAFRALNVVSDFTFVIPSPLQNTTQVVVGQRLGARDAEGARFFLRKARRWSLLLSTVFAVLFAVFAKPFAYMMTLNWAAASAAALPLALHMVTLPVKTWAMVSLAPIRASGDTRFSLILGVTCAAIVVPAAYYGITFLHIGLFSVPLAWIGAWVARLVVTEIKLARGSWSRRELVRV